MTITSWPEPRQLVSIRKWIVRNHMDRIVASRAKLPAWEIEPYLIRRLQVLHVQNAAPHSDYDWTTVWVVHANGHELRTRVSGARTSARLPLRAGSIVSFDAKKQHWTRNGTGVMLFYAHDTRSAPTEVDVAAMVSRIKADTEGQT